ncbi:Citrate lyase beta chain [hydrothermal vent metagenome]|uniref:Citrate lyase beta chain n=1 Tax=hydrothermal vent metagenome TaxID=652676 RepID=A0A1W1BVZ5_9ZZZZ
MRKIDYYELGATLYIPIMHKNLELILKKEKYPYLKSVVICLEDSTALSDMPSGMRRLREIVENFQITDLKVFIRPRDIKNFREILQFKDIQRIDGFALAKFDTDNIAEYLSIFIQQNHFYIMPILETQDVFNTLKLQDIFKELTPFKEKILVVRIGGEDILSMLGMMRDCDKSIYEVMPLYLVLSTIINIFKPNGFEVSSPVNACFKNENTLLRELEGDREHQLFNKTCIHPEQAYIIQESYRVSIDDYKVAVKLIEEDRAIFSENGRMYEKSTHSNWAKSIIRRYKNYGVIDAK